MKKATKTRRAYPRTSTQSSVLPNLIERGTDGLDAPLYGVDVGSTPTLCTIDLMTFLKWRREHSRSQNISTSFPYVCRVRGESATYHSQPIKADGHGTRTWKVVDERVGTSGCGDAREKDALRSVEYPRRVSSVVLSSSAHESEEVNESTVLSTTRTTYSYRNVSGLTGVDTGALQVGRHFGECVGTYDSCAPERVIGVEA